MKKIVQFFKDLQAELAKVAWSTPRDLGKATVVVLIGTVFLTGFIFVTDIALTNFLNFIIK